jgi:hypothetical protein
MRWRLRIPLDLERDQLCVDLADEESKNIPRSREGTDPFFKAIRIIHGHGAEDAEGARAGTGRWIRCVKARVRRSAACLRNAMNNVIASRAPSYGSSVRSSPLAAC